MFASSCHCQPASSRHARIRHSAFARHCGWCRTELLLPCVQPLSTTPTHALARRRRPCRALQCGAHAPADPGYAGLGRSGRAGNVDPVAGPALRLAQFRLGRGRQRVGRPCRRTPGGLAPDRAGDRARLAHPGAHGRRACGCARRGDPKRRTPLRHAPAPARVGDAVKAIQRVRGRHRSACAVV